MQIVLFTGAGAAKADGAPLQTELFREFFAARGLSATRQALQDELRELFERVFYIDPRSTPGDSLPTFEEALGILELAIAREEGILGLGEREALGDLRRIRRQLVLALAATIGRESRVTDSHHAKLIDGLRQGGVLGDVTFVTTNYDTLLDEAIDERAILTGRGTGSVVDYGFGELVPSELDLHADPHRFSLLKIHGSLNWLYCPVCSLLDITHASHGVTRLIDNRTAARCSDCQSLRTPVIVPPSYYKDVSNVYLAVVWSRAFRAILEADILIFCGYSFPDADMHVKYLAKRAQLNRQAHARPLQILLVNHHRSKTDEAADAEADRFTRFLGKGEFWDTRLSFQEFAETVGDVITQASRR